MKQNVSRLVFGLILVVAMFLSSFNAVFAQSFLPAFTQDELDNNWVPDRTFPTGNVTSVTAFGRENVARIGIDNTQTQVGTFYRTEGIKTSVGNFGTEVQVDLYLDSDWQSKAVRAGLWVVGDDGAGNVDDFYGIIEFINAETCPTPDCTNYSTVPTHTGFRIWDSNSGWLEPYLTTPFTWDSWVSLRIVLDTANNEYQYYINDTLVGSAAGGSNFIREVFLNSYNYGLDNFPTLSSDSYAAHWQNGAPTVQSCTEYQNVYVTTINEGDYNLDWTQQRATGHHEYLSDGVTDSLHLWTEGATTTDKVAGYFILDQARPLTEFGELLLNYTASFGIEPGGQLVIDINNNDLYDVGVDPILVLEDAYQQIGEDPIWWSHYDFGVGSTIVDYATLASLNRIMEENPDLKFIGYGWSLGSGVYGDGKITSFTAACVNYTFGLEKITVPAPTDNSIVACNTYGSVVLPVVEGALITANPENAQVGDVTVTATALPGYKILGDTEWVVSLGEYYLCPAQVVKPVPVPITHCEMEGNIYYFQSAGLTFVETPADAIEGIVDVSYTVADGYEAVGPDLGPWQFDLGTYSACVPETVTVTDTVTVTVTQPVTVNVPVTTEVPVTVTQPITVNIPVTTEVPVTVTQPVTVNVPVTTEVPVTVTIPVTVNIPVTTEVPFTVTQPITIEVPVTTEVPITVTQPITVNVPITTEVPVTKTVVVTNSIRVTETVFVTDSVTYVEPGWPYFKDPTCQDQSVALQLPESERVAYATEGDTSLGGTVTVRSSLKVPEKDVFLSGVISWVHTFPTIESLNCTVGEDRLYFPEVSR